MKINRKLLRIIILTIEILAILSTLPVLYIGVDGGYYSNFQSFFQSFIELPLTTFLLVVLPLIFIIISIYMLTKTLKTKEISPEIVSNYKKFNVPLLISYLLVSILLIGFVGFAQYSDLTEEPSAFFPFDDKLASYTVIQEYGLYYLHYETTSGRYNGFPTDMHRVPIGKSDADLQSFIGKKVVIDDGKFVFAKKQCIAGKCIDYGANNFVGLDIKSIRQAN